MRSNDALRILHTESSCGWGGQEIRILSEAEGMIARGHAVVLLCPAEAPISAAARLRGIPVENLPIQRKSWRGFRALYAWFRQNGKGFDVVNTHSSTDSWLVALARIITGRVPPIVRTRHVSSPVHGNRPTRWLYLSAASHVAVTGEALRDVLHTVNGFPRAHMTSVPTGIDLDRFSPADRQHCRAALGLPERHTLGILATLRNWKGHTFLLEAFKKIAVNFPDWQLLIVGDGPQRKNLEALVDKLALRDSVHFAGNQENVPDWLNSMDLFCLPSYGDEGVPQSIMQAMACETAVVSTPVGAIGEAVDKDVTGLLVPPRDVTALASALADLMSDSPRRKAMAQAGRKRAESRFGLEIMLDRMENIFRTFGRGKI